MDVLETITFVGSIFIVIYLFIMQPNQVKGSSMDPTFTTEDYILTSKITYKFREPKRGDIIVFKAPGLDETEFIKRIIGIPGDTVKIQDGNIFVNNTLFDEEYISSRTSLWQDSFVQNGVPLSVPPGHYFVLGDNRAKSSDSRRFGFIPQSSIIGVVVYRYYPPGKMGTITNPVTQ